MNSHRGLVAVCFLLCAFSVLPRAKAEESKGAMVTGSRAPESGCEWKRVWSKDTKFSLLAQDCDFDSRKITHSIEKSALIQKFSDSPTGDKIIEIFEKDPAEAPEAALKRLFIDKLSTYEQKHCIAKQTKSKYILEKPFSDGTKSAWVIEPDAAYSTKIKKNTPKDDIPPESCGEYGLPVDSRAYFEFHSGNKNSFAWVIVGQDTPLFDEQSIDF